MSVANVSPRVAETTGGTTPRNEVSMRAQCSIPDCHRPQKARGWCDTHYWRSVHWGDPSAHKPVRVHDRSVVERFWSQVEKTPTCWLWRGAVTPDGYGLFNPYGVPVRVHRWAYEQKHKRIPRGLHLDHLCNVRNCVRLSHLEAVTQKENNLRSRKRERALNGGLLPSQRRWSLQQLDRGVTECPLLKVESTRETIRAFLQWMGTQPSKRSRPIYIRRK